MNTRQKINLLKRKIRQRLTSQIGKSYFSPSSAIIKPNINRILICRPNQRLGNLLLLTPLIQEVISTFPNCEIDLFLKESVGSVIFKNYKNVNTIVEIPRKPLKNIGKYIGGFITIRKNRYDLVINAVQKSSTGRLATRLANSKLKVFGWDDKSIASRFDDYDHIAKYQIYTLRSYLQRGKLKENNKKIPALNLQLSADELKNGADILKNLVNNQKKTICIYTHATADKCYSSSWWWAFYLALKTKYKDYNIIEILPIENISKISFKAPTFYSKDIREMAALMANTKMFIGADCGVMHLASAASIPTVGFFSRSNMYYYEPYNKGSIGIDTNTNTFDDCMQILDKVLNEK